VQGLGDAAFMTASFALMATQFPDFVVKAAVRRIPKISFEN